ncbi:DUF3077 domain-containing protein [Pseudomonas sp. GD03944]|uniref:DUF3077 domain-containing protein n=1 Tax=Pseudomonas sp. GD03944 TaxID=2975409 RepID=UPI00244CA4C5|nr:DUF3077 domain-containing protein [Pseudomonas sp. GD03944]MDH1264471.1 DUF3077 domain-containing protein [Pseudomonas sp. GD03944]
MKDSCSPTPAASAARTISTLFHPCNAARQPLFAVQPGVPVADALDSAYCLLDVAEELALQLNHTDAQRREQMGHACACLVEMAKATVRACVEGIGKASRQH